MPSEGSLSEGIPGRPSHPNRCAAHCGQVVCSHRNDRRRANLGRTTVNRSLFNTFAPNIRVAVLTTTSSCSISCRGFARVPDRQVTLPDRPYRVRGLDIVRRCVVPPGAPSWLKQALPGSTSPPLVIITEADT